MIRIILALLAIAAVFYVGHQVQKLRFGIIADQRNLHRDLDIKISKINKSIEESRRLDKDKPS